MSKRTARQRAEKGGAEAGCWPLALGGRNTKIHALADVKGRLIAILLTTGEAHDCPVAERLVRRVKPSKRMLGDRAYDSAELREDLHERGTKPVIPNRCNRKQPFSFSKRLYKLRWRIERQQVEGFQAYRDPLRQAGTKLSGLCLPRRCSCMVDLMSLDPSLVQWPSLRNFSDQLCRPSRAMPLVVL